MLGLDDHAEPIAPGRHVQVIEVAAAATHDLRRRVLRSGTASADVTFVGDDDADTVHLAVRDAVTGQLVAVSTWLSRPAPGRPDDRAVQLRGMAVDPAHQGRSLGTLLLDAGLERARTRSALVVWARARDTALDFYVRHGFAVTGEGYVDTTTGLPHHDVVRDLR